MSDPQTTAPRRKNSVFQEAMRHAITMHGPLSKREQEIAETAARSAYFWTIRETIEMLDERVNANAQG